MTAAREAERQVFLSRVGWGAAARSHLAGDASARSYERLAGSGRSAVLMDSPPGPADDTEDFIRVARHLEGLGLSVPRILEAEPARGLLLLEDLGDALYTQVLKADPLMERPLYDAAVDVLLALQSAPPPGEVPDLSAQGWAAATGLAPEFYAGAILGQSPDAAAFTECLAAAMARHADAARVLILRDYHAGNLIWLPVRKGLARVGLLDFQQAQKGQPGYDLVSLLQDARRDVAAETETAGIARFAAGAGLPVAEFAPAYATLGAQRALRILGIFARLCLIAAKPGYVALIPRVWGQLMANLAHPALSSLRRECLTLLPEPTPENLSRIIARCGLPLSP
ncbi:MAG: phosphotransferase [Rhodobacter sp.]|nr:phosphotransferase [Rhodobacter sp.]